jgi:hypothetical protein
MPTIRRYERQVLPRPAGPPAAVPEAFGAGIGRAMEQMGRSLGQTGDVVVNVMVEKELQKDKARVRDVLNRAIEQDREFMADQYARKGADGVTVYDDAKSYFEESKRRWMGELSTPGQQELFAAAYDPRVGSHLDAAQSYQNKQIEIYDQATKNAFISQTTNDAVLMRRNPGFVAASLAEVIQTTRELYRHLGKEAADAAVLEATGAFHAGIIEADMEDDPAAAEKYFDRAVVQTQIPEKMKAVLRQKLSHASLNQQTYERADFVAGDSDDPVERMKMARESDPKIRAGVTALIKARNAEEKQFRADALEKLLDVKTNEILNAKALEPALKIADTLEKGSARLTMVKLAESLYGGGVKTIAAKLMEARILIDRRKIPSKLALWRDYKPYVSDDDWPALESYFQNGGAAGGLTDSSVRSIYKGRTGKTDDAVKPEEYNWVWDYVLRNLPEGRKPTDDILRDLVGQAIIGGRIPIKNWPDTKMTYGEAVEKGETARWVPNISKDVEDQIIRKLNEVGIPVTEERIRKFYLHEIEGVPRPARSSPFKAPQIPANEMTDAQLDDQLRELGAPVDAHNREVLRKNLKGENNAAK